MDAVEAAPDEGPGAVLGDVVVRVDRVANAYVIRAEDRSAEVLPRAGRALGTRQTDARVGITPRRVAVVEVVNAVHEAHVRRPQEALALPAWREREDVADELPRHEV